MKFYVRRKRPPVINIVTLIDILILLLIFFVITTTFKREDHALGINLPESSSAQPAAQAVPEPTMIYATKSEKIFIGKEEVALSELAAVLKTRKAQSADVNFGLKADKEVPLGFAVKVLDAFTQAGVPILSLSTAEAQKP